MTRTTLALAFAQILAAQHVEYLTTPNSRLPAVSPAYRDSQGRVVVLQHYFGLSLGIAPNNYYAVERFSDGLERPLSSTALLKLPVGPSSPASQLDSLDRLYLGGDTGDGKPWLSREDGWSMELPSMKGRVVGISFDRAGDPIALVTSSGRPGLWRADRTSGAITASIEFGRAGQMATALRRDGSGAFFATAGASIFRIADDLSGVDFERPLGADTQLTALAVTADGLFVTGSTFARDASDPNSFRTTEGVFMAEPPARLAPGKPVAIVAKLNPVTGTLVAATYLGGKRSEEGRAVVVDTGGVYVLGTTASRDFPATGAYRTPCGPDRGPLQSASFVTKLKLDFSEVLRSATFPFTAVPFLPDVSRGELLLKVGPEFVRLDMDRNDESTITCIVSGASYTPQFGVFGSRELITLFGQGLGPKDALTFEGQGLRRLPREAGGTEVLLAGVPTPLLAVLDTQVNFMATEARFPVPGTLEVRRNGITVFRGLLGVQDLPAPVALVRVLQSGAAVLDAKGTLVQADVINEDGTANSASNPAARGSVVTVFFTGTGTLRDPNPEDDIAGELPATPTLFRHFIETDTGYVEPELVTTQNGRNKGVLQMRWRLPATAGGEFAFRVRGKTVAAENVRYGVDSFLFVRP